MKNNIKRIIATVLVVLMLFFVVGVPAMAAGTVTIELSAASGYVGNGVAIRGTADAGEWVSIKATDEDGGIVYFDAACCDDTGNYSVTWIVPDVDAGILTITAGYGSVVVSETFTVKAYVYINTDDEDEDDEDEDEATIGDEEGNTISGTVEETEDGYDIIIGGDDFAAVSGGAVTIKTQFVEVVFDQTAAEYISDTAGTGSIVLSIVNADKSALSDEARSLIGDRPAYEFSLVAGDTSLATFGGGLAYVSIPYTPADNEDVNRVVIYYITDDGELIVMTDSSYDGTSINAKFSTGHFSVYAVGYSDISFDDVSEDSWYYDAVTFCAAREITSGTGNNLFSPDATLTRGQFITLLLRAYGIEVDEDASENYNDAGDTYYTGYLASAKRLGITNGVGDNMFAPEDEITRQDMFTLLYRALGVLEELPDTDGSTSLSDYNDTDDIADYAKDAMETFVTAGIISGSGGKLDPLGGSTRAQMAQVLYNLFVPD